VISQITGTLLAKALDRVEIMTPGGVGYELLVPLSVYETLPKPGETVHLHAHLVVKEDGWQLFGFSNAFERHVFQRVLDAKGVGPALAYLMSPRLGKGERAARTAGRRDRDAAVARALARLAARRSEEGSLP